MRELARTDRFKKLYRKLPESIKKKVKRQLGFLAEDTRHRSLYAKKMSGREGIWEARVDFRHRMTFQIAGDRIILRAVGPHDLLKKP
jgi:mRNA-degrading endonuclease RelE of RelBE toxin-antitoxin system